MMLNIVLFILSLIGSACTIIGGITVAFWLKSNAHPDPISNFDSWWLGLSRPDIVTDMMAELDMLEPSQESD